jgi:F-type H+-transporting ATPase subunit a
MADTHDKPGAHDDHGAHKHDPFDPGHLIGHVKDSHFIEVPDGLTSKRKVGIPQIRATQPGEYGPQPVWTLHSGNPTLDDMVEPLELGITKFMVIEVIAGIIICFLFVRLGQLIHDGTPAKGTLWNLLETMLLFIRDQVARPAIGGGHHDDHGHGDHGHGHGDHGHGSYGHDPGSDALEGAVHGDHGAELVMSEKVNIHEEHGHLSVAHPADKYLPFLWTLFFFVLGMNLLGLVPWAGSPTGALAVTATMAMTTFLVVVGSGMVALGPVGFWLAQVPRMELPMILAIFLKPMILAIEILGLCIKHLILAVRLLANVMAGHLVLVVLLSFIVAAAGAGSAIHWSVSIASILGAAALSLLELFVAFLQAYIFTFLTALFIGAALHEH